MAASLATRIAEEYAAVAASLPAEVVSRERRRRAVEMLEAEGLPTSRDENWRYANLRPLDKVRFTPAPVDVPVVAQNLVGADETLLSLPAPIESYTRYTFVDGVLVLSPAAAKKGITVASLRERATRGQATTSTESPDAPKSKDARFALLNDAFATDGVSIRVTAGTDCPTCIELLFVATADAQTASSYPRVEIQVESDARLGIIERHVTAATGVTNFVNSSVRVDIARGATVNHYRVQESGPQAIWLDTLSAVLAQDATYKLQGVSVGGLSARSTVNVRLAGERADAEISVASLGDKQQFQDAFVVVEHIAPYARSSQTFRGISAGRARVAFNGMVVVRENAKGTDSQQSLRGLLAGPEAEIDVRPQLEIYTDDVRCAHGATAGKLDDNMLFYLLSRGIDPATAQSLLKWAFLEDVVARIAIPELRRQIERSIAGQMQEAAILKGYV